MDKGSKFHRWMGYFFFFTILVLLTYYVKWFRLTPLVFDNSERWFQIVSQNSIDSKLSNYQFGFAQYTTLFLPLFAGAMFAIFLRAVNTSRSIVIVTFVLIFVFFSCQTLPPAIFYYEPTYTYILGVILLIAYSVFASLLLADVTVTLKKPILLLGSLFLVGNIFFLKLCMPSIVWASACNGASYYIVVNRPYPFAWLDDHRTTQFTKWSGFFYYESFPLDSRADKFEIVCDKQNGEANVIKRRSSWDQYELVYTDSEQPRTYVGGIMFENNRYALSVRHDADFSLCTYSIYNCKSNFTSCVSVPLQYVGNCNVYFGLEVREQSDDVGFYNWEDDILISSYGEQPRCYVEGCSILEK